MRGQIIFFAQNHRQAAAGCIACDAGAIDAAADDQHITDFVVADWFHWLGLNGLSGELNKVQLDLTPSAAEFEENSQIISHQELQKRCALLIMPDKDNL